jgi:hydroxyacylglutathione hydrolase
MIRDQAHQGYRGRRDCARAGVGAACCGPVEMPVVVDWRRPSHRVRYADGQPPDRPGSLAIRERHDMAVDIIEVTVGFCRCYALRGEGVVVVDAGAPNMARRFVRGLERASISPRDVGLIVLTHGHWDHVGSAGDLKSLTGAKLAMHRSEVDWLEQSLTPLPPGATAWGRWLISLHWLFMPFIRLPAAKVDLPLDDEGLSLNEYGVPGRVFHTPGHTAGSVSVVLDTGEACVGDLAMNKFPLRLSPGLPIFAEDPAAVVRSLAMLLKLGVTRLYPAHGKPFSAQIFRRMIPS